MTPHRRARARVNLACLFLLAVSGTASGSPLAPVYVFYGPYDEKRVEQELVESHRAVETMYQDYGLVGGLISRWAFASAIRKADELSVVALGEAGITDFADRVVDRWGCFGLPEDTIDCRSTIVLGPSSASRVSEAANQEELRASIAAFVVKAYVDTIPRATVAFLGERPNGDLVKFAEVGVWYEDSPPLAKSEQISPFYKDQAKVSDKEKGRLAPVREKWLSGDPSPLETNITGFVETLPDVLHYLYISVPSADDPLDLRAWYESLPPIKPIAKDRGVNCQNDDCKNRLVKIDSIRARAWIARYYGNDLLIRVVPCNRLWCDEAE